MRMLDFLNYVQRPYTNATVRNGYKWSNLKIGEVVTLSDNGKHIEEAWVKQVLVKKFSDIKPEDIKREHDSSCKGRNDLFKVMTKAYPGFSKDFPVTIITYVRKS